MHRSAAYTPEFDAAPRPSLLWRIAASRFVLAMLAVALAAALALWWIRTLGGLHAFRDQYGSTAPLVMVPIHTAVASLPIPTDPICVANGALFGFWRGALYSWIGWNLAASIKFWLGRRAREDFDLEAKIAKLPRTLRRFPVGHPAFLIGSRMIPWLGGNVSTYLPGAAGVAYSRHLWCAALAIIPGAVLAAGLGAGLFR